MAPISPSQPRKVGSLLANNRPKEPAQAPAAPPPAPPAGPDMGQVASAISAQADSIRQLAQSVSEQASRPIQVEMQPPAPRSYLITVNRKDEKSPVASYLVEPLATSN